MKVDTKQYELDKESESTLNTLVATEAKLYFKTKRAHWLASGPTFKEIHELLDEHASFIISSIDEIAERIVMLSGIPVTDLDEFNTMSCIVGFKSAEQNAQLQELTLDHQTISNIMRVTIDQLLEKNDPGSIDILTKLVQKHEKAAWYLGQISGQRAAYGAEARKIA